MLSLCPISPASSERGALPDCPRFAPVTFTVISFWFSKEKVYRRRKYGSYFSTSMASCIAPAWTYPGSESAPAGQAIHHAADGGDLIANAGVIVVVAAIAPPVPAGIGIIDTVQSEIVTGDGLGEQNDDVVAVGPRQVAGVGDVGRADGGGVLLASVDRHVQLTGLTFGAGRRHVDVSRVGHADSFGLGRELLLAELDDLAGQLRRLGVEVADQEFQNVAGLVAITVNDVGTGGDRAGIAMVQGQVGVTSGNGVNVHEVVRLDAQVRVETAGRGGCDRVHRRVHGAGEDVNLVVLDVGQGRDQALSLGLPSCLQRFGGTGAAINLWLHAFVGGEGQSALGAIERPAGDDRDTINDV